ncbi:uncharacterized protein LOC133312436 [Gastrolobium bilobum]|uniref:uncharacterized protein LOC133312436 n=1 Tax=Gastrolobium bilobum TaxID=150636 RepID=UPI002AB3159B|nr:uncharacterized protein LOC133312436 [Gastrolobium bilobum]
MPNPEFLAAKFLRGLNEQIKEKIAGTGDRDMASLINQCRRIEEMIQRRSRGKSSQPVKIEEKKAGNSSGYWKKGKGKNLSVKPQNNKFKKNFNQKGFVAKPTNPPKCTNCGKDHWGACHNSHLICYRCGKSGHYARDCYQAGGQTQIVQVVTTAPTTGRVYTVDAKEVEKAPNMIRGTIFIDTFDFRVLFDSGVTHSFISGQVAFALNLPMFEFSPPMEVTTATREKCRIDVYCKNVKFMYEGREYTIDLYCLPMLSLEIILGMDWLAKYGVMLDCCSKRVIVPRDEANSTTSTFTSVLQVSKALREGSQGYIFMGVVEEKKKTDLSKILVVSEFIDVFPEEVTQLPPEREIEFSIDLIPGVGPISMAPLELKELKTQLEDLLSKQFIRPSVSPWGTPAIFVKKKDGP